MVYVVAVYCRGSNVVAVYCKGTNVVAVYCKGTNVVAEFDTTILDESIVDHRIFEKVLVVVVVAVGDRTVDEDHSTCFYVGV